MTSNQPLFRLTLITIGGLTSIITSIVAACLRISTASWLSWGQLALMFCVFASVNFLMFCYTLMRKGGDVKVRYSEINLTMFGFLFYVLLASRAYYIYDSHVTEADLVKHGLPTDVNDFTTIAQALASIRIQAFCELILALNCMLAYFWITNAFLVYHVIKKEKGTASHHHHELETVPNSGDDSD